jgi:tetratricopeptide (TPR) repeat protein
MKIMTLTAMMVLLSFSVSFSDMNYDCPKSKAGSEYGNRGARLWEAGKLDEAEKETRQAIKVDPDCSMWQQNLGFILEDKNKRDEANEAFLKSLKIDKNWCTSYKTGSLLKIGEYYYNKRTYKESISYLTQASDMAAKEKANIDTKALIFTYLSYNYTDPKELGNPYYNLKKAEELKKKALALKPNDLFIKASLAKLLVLQKRTDEANNSVKEILAAQAKASKPISSVYSYIAHIYSLQKDPKSAALYIGKAIDLNPKQEASYLLDELTRDFKDVSKSKEMQPVIARARNTLK